MALTEEKIKIYGKDDSPESFVRFVPEIVDELEVIDFKIKPIEDILNKSFVYPLFEIGGANFRAVE